MKPVYIRELTISDAKIYKSISYGEALHRYVAFMEARTIEDAERVILSNTNMFTRIYGIFRSTDGQIVGALITSWFELKHEMTVHYFIGERYRKQHYARESILVLSRFLKKSCLDVRTLHFEIRENNKASISLQESLGSTLVEKNNKYCFYDLSV